jgi:hypothetical protein
VKEEIPLGISRAYSSRELSRQCRTRRVARRIVAVVEQAIMKTGRQCLALGGFALLLLGGTAAFAQKIKSDYDKSNDFTRYRKYAIGKNYLLTHQGLDRQAFIDKILVESLNRQLQAKGFVPDENHPDFRIKYEAGALTESKASAQPDMLNGGAPSPTWTSSNLGGVPLDVWSSTLTKLKLTVTDASSGKPVWTALASEKIRDPQKVLNDLNKLNAKIDDFMTKTLKSFPPNAKRK